MDRIERIKSALSKLKIQKRYIVKVDDKVIFSSNNRDEALKKYHIFKGDSESCEYFDNYLMLHWRN